MLFPILSNAQDITLQFANPNIDANQGSLCLDVEAKSNKSNIFLNQLNIRFYIDEDQMSLDELKNPNPLMSLQYGNNSQTGANADPFGFSGNFIYVLDKLVRISNQGVELDQGNPNWNTYLFEACFNVNTNIDLINLDVFCPSLVWAQNEAGIGGFANGSEGVQAIAMDQGGNPSIELDEIVNQFNWDYNNSGGSFGGTNIDDCISLDFCMSINLKVFLEGVLINTGNNNTYYDAMRTNLNQLGILPGQTHVDQYFGNIYSPAGQTYNTQPWN